MTSTAHPSLEVLSEYAEGLLPTDDLTTVHAHLDECATCRARLDELLTVPRLLRSAETPPMPDEVGDRVLAALAEEADRRAADTGVVSLSRRRHEDRTERAGRRPGRRRGRGRPSRALGVAASVAVLGAAGTIGFQMIFAEQPEQGGALHSTDQSRSTESDAGTYVLADGKVTLSARSFDEEVRSAVRPGGPRPGEGRSDGQGGGSSDGDRQGEDSRERQGEGRGKVEPGPGHDTELFGSQASPERCAVQTVRATDPSAVLDQTSATYDGKPAILVITEGSGPGTVHAFVVTGCPVQGTIARDAEVGLAR